MGTPTIAGDLGGTIIEGDINISGDLDDIGTLTGNNDDIFSVVVQGTYGTATINSSTGEWTYTLDNSDPAVIALGSGDTLTDIFRVNMLDTGGVGNGLSDAEDITITINGVVCFVAGTMISTVAGVRAVETLVPGDMILTGDGVSRPIRWIGSLAFTEADLGLNPKLRPVRIKAGALGAGLPLRDLLVSRQHRMLVRSTLAEQIFGVREVLLPAVKLTGLPGVRVDNEVRSLTYFHLLFDRHEIVFAEGAPAESLFAGPEALKAISPEAREEILTIVPQIAERAYDPAPVRTIPQLDQQKRLIQCHRRKKIPLIKTEKPLVF